MHVQIRKVTVVRWGGGARRFRPLNPVLIEAPREWAAAMLSLARLSDEHRHAGLLVTNLAPGSRAGRAGIARGDVLLRYDGVQLERPETLSRLVSRLAEGEGGQRRVAVDLLRGDEEHTVEVPEGRLGITVSALLHQLAPRRGTSQKALRAQTDAPAPAPSDSAFIEVRGELAGKMLLLRAALAGSGGAKMRKRAEGLLSAAAGTA